MTIVKTTVKKPRAKRVKSKFEFKTVIDGDGNRIVSKQSELKNTITLHLKGERRGRRIGVINKKRRVFEVSRSRSKHLYLATNSYGFNHTILEKSTQFDFIRLRDESTQWDIPKAYILENGHFLHHQKQGFERQIFIKLEQIEQFKKKSAF